MSELCLPLIVNKKTSKSWELRFKKDGNYTNITDWAIYFTVKSKMTDLDTDAVIKKDITSHTDPEAGKTLISISPSDTDIDVGDYWYDIKYVDDEGNSDIIIKGKLTIKRTITTRG